MEQRAEFHQLVIDDTANESESKKRTLDESNSSSPPERDAQRLKREQTSKVSLETAAQLTFEGGQKISRYRYF